MKTKLFMLLKFGGASLILGFLIFSAAPGYADENIEPAGLPDCTAEEADRGGFVQDLPVDQARCDGSRYVYMQVVKVTDNAPGEFSARYCIKPGSASDTPCGAAQWAGINPQPANTQTNVETTSEYAISSNIGNCSPNGRVINDEVRVDCDSARGERVRIKRIEFWDYNQQRCVTDDQPGDPIGPGKYRDVYDGNKEKTCGAGSAQSARGGWDASGDYKSPDSGTSSDFTSSSKCGGIAEGAFDCNAPGSSQCDQLGNLVCIEKWYQTEPTTGQCLLVDKPGRIVGSCNPNLSRNSGAQSSYSGTSSDFTSSPLESRAPSYGTLVSARPRTFLSETTALEIVKKNIESFNNDNHVEWADLEGFVNRVRDEIRTAGDKEFMQTEESAAPSRWMTNLSDALSAYKIAVSSINSGFAWDLEFWRGYIIVQCTYQGQNCFTSGNVSRPDPLDPQKLDQAAREVARDFNGRFEKGERVGGLPEFWQAVQDKLQWKIGLMNWANLQDQANINQITVKIVSGQFDVQSSYSNESTLVEKTDRSVIAKNVAREVMDEMNQSRNSSKEALFKEIGRRLDQKWPNQGWGNNNWYSVEHILQKSPYKVDIVLQNGRFTFRGETASECKPGEFDKNQCRVCSDSGTWSAEGAESVWKQSSVDPIDFCVCASKYDPNYTTQYNRPSSISGRKIESVDYNVGFFTRTCRNIPQPRSGQSSPASVDYGPWVQGVAIGPDVLGGGIGPESMSQKISVVRSEQETVKNNGDFVPTRQSKALPQGLAYLVVGSWEEVLGASSTAWNNIGATFNRTLSQVLSTTPAVAQIRDISFATGWNLMSFDVQPKEGLTAQGLLQMIAQQGGYAMAVSTLEDGAWKSYVIRGDKVFSGTDFAILPGRAYFVKFVVPVNLVLEGQTISQPIKVKLWPGWNTVGWPGSRTDYKAADLIEEMNTKGLGADAVARFDYGLWDAFIKKVENYGNNFPVENNRGYLLRVEKEGEMTP